MPESSLYLTKFEHRAVIKFLVKKGKTAKEIFEETSSVYGESGTSSATVKRWTRLFQQGRETLEDDLRSGRPNTAVTDENIEKDNLEEICTRIVTVDETWIRQYDPESKQEPMQWIEKGERPPKKFKVEKSASKLIATIFWDCEGVLLIDYLPKKTTMNAEYYAGLLKKVREAIVEKRRGKISKGILFLQDNAPVHTARIARQALLETGFDEVNHPPYSPDLAPSDYFSFKNLKKDLRGRRFGDDEEMKVAVNEHFLAKDAGYFLSGIQALYKRCQRNLVTQVHGVMLCAAVYVMIHRASLVEAIVYNFG
ncbi:histone-lysine N-methyltransferase SETMAR-like [Melitaea cinxia]|uniref:histone-lysine N-methyltransferase SETMAR-like n=1 Tax=Melitaea cinxia TaxID=113334 RepID=UPI001E273A1E|nr:histone-lysine N-methyltransferase SETMAR-like [Melitaea cinxia]